MSFAGTAEADLTANDGLKLWFTPGQQCCGGGPNPPNSFTADGIMTLWGANGFDISAFQNDPQSGWASTGGNFTTTIGLDLRVHLVPEPTSLLLMGVGMLGLSMRRRVISA